jgi:hypothetical protein
MSDQRKILVAMRSDITSGASESKANVRRQVQLEVEIEALMRLQSNANRVFSTLINIAKRWRDNQGAKRDLPSDSYSQADKSRLYAFQSNFRENAEVFGYKSAPVAEIEISADNLIPSLAKMELREIRTDIKADSSASDFVRLIWSYLIALYQVSSKASPEGNHPGLIMFDEPGQHSMAVDSQRALLQVLSGEKGLQSIVAASFDESEEVFNQATKDVDFSLIEWEGKLLRPL